MTRASLLFLLPLLGLAGCLSNSYVVDRSELDNLARMPPEERWKAVRAVQNVGGDDNPPDNESSIYTSGTQSSSSGGGGGAIIFVGSSHHHHHHHHYHEPSRVPPARPMTPATPTPGIASGAGGAAGAGAGAVSPAKAATSASKGNGSTESAVIVAAAVVAGAAVGIGMIATEGVRYDGWLAVNPDEPLHLKMRHGYTEAVPLSALTPELAMNAREGTIYEGSAERYEKLGRAPLNRKGFTLTTAFHMAGIPQVERSIATGLGGYLHIGGNIANVVSLGLAGTADSGIDSRGSLLLATIAPEIQLFPIPIAGLYFGGGWAFRNSGVYDGTRADQGWMMRGGFVGEIPLTTRLAIQLRFGGAKYDFNDRYSPISWEGLAGFAVY